MKRDLERWGDKLTPDEERRIWSKMKSALREGKTVDSARARPWLLRPWVTSAAVAAAAVVVVIAVWRTHEPKQFAGMPEVSRGVQEVIAPQTQEGVADVEGAMEPKAISTMGAEKPGVPGDAAGGKRGIAEDELLAEGQVAEEERRDGGAVADEVEFLAAKEKKQPAPDAPPVAAGKLGGQVGYEASKGQLVQEGVQFVEDAELDDAARTKGETPATSGEMTPEGKEQKAVQEASGPDAATKSPGESSESLMAAAESAGETTEGLSEAAPGRARAAAESSIRMAQTSDAGEIKGKVTDGFGHPLANAQVKIVGTRIGTLTDEKGFFGIKHVPAGTCTLRVTLTGYAELLVVGVVVEEGQVRDVLALELSDKEAGGPDVIYCGDAGKSMAAVIPQELELSEEASEEEYIPPTSFDPQVSPDAADVVGKSDLQWADRKQKGSTTDESRAGEIESLKSGTRIRERRQIHRSPKYPSGTGGRQPVNDELADDMFFQHYGTNPFVDADEDALSTFGLDVDTGSYTICRRYIREGHLPPVEAVRVEEFVNFFRKDFTPPRRENLRVHIDGMPSPFAHVQDGSYWLLRVGIRGKVISERDRLPAQIVLVIDTSGSMQGGNRLGLLKDSMDVLLDELRPDDEIGVIEFKTRARVVLPLTPISEGHAVYRAIHSLHADGSTNAEHGLELGYKMMRRGAREGRIHRVILCSDGVANEGNTGWEKILENVRRERDRISLTTIGFGMGNYNDVLLEQLADAGDGQYAYVDELREATRVLRDNFTGTIQTIARDAKAQIEFDPRHVEKYRLLGYENRDVRDQDFRRDDVDAGEIGSGHEVTVLYEVKLRPEVGRRRLGTVHLRYEDPERGRVVELDEPVRISDFRAEVYDAPADLVIDACVAEFAEILRESYWAKDGSLVDVLDLLRDATREMASQPEVDELLNLVERAIDLSE